MYPTPTACDITYTVQDLDKLSEWATIKWLLNFSVPKCVVFHFISSFYGTLSH